MQFYPKEHYSKTAPQFLTDYWTSAHLYFWETAFLSFIHPFSILAYSNLEVTGGLKPISAVIGREAGYTLDRTPVHHRAIETNNRPFLTLTPKVNLESLINLTCVFLGSGRTVLNTTPRCSPRWANVLHTFFFLDWGLYNQLNCWPVAC